MRGASTGASVQDDVSVAGISTAHAEILTERVASQKAEMEQMRKRMKEQQARFNELSSRVTEERQKNASLQTQLNTTLATAAKAEEAEKQAQAALLRERESTKIMRDGYERQLATMRQRQEAVARDAAFSAVPAVAPSQIVPATQSELSLLQEKYTRHCREIGDATASSFERLGQLQMESESAIFRARSSMQSCATELDAKVCHLQSVVECVGQALQEYSSSEDEASKAILSLMAENKELWNRISRLKYESDKYQAELQSRKPLDGMVRKEELDMAVQQNAHLTEQLKKVQLLLDEQRSRLSEHESLMAKLVAELKMSHEQLSVVTEERDLLSKNQQDVHQRTDELQHQLMDARASTEDLRQEKVHLQNQVFELNSKIHDLQDLGANEHQNMIHQLEAERDEALQRVSRLSADLEEAVVRIKQSDRTNADRIQYLENKIAALEEEKSHIAEQYDAELNSATAAYKKDLADVRRDCQEKMSELIDVRRQYDGLQQEVAALKDAQRVAESRIGSFQQEHTSIVQTHQKLQVTYQQTIKELETTKAQNLVFDSKLKGLESNAAGWDQRLSQQKAQYDMDIRRLQAQATKLEQQLRDSETLRQQQLDELKRVRQKTSEEQSIRQLRESMERERANMEAENQRLHETYKAVAAENEELKGAIAQLGRKQTSVVSVQQEVSELQRRLQEVPAMKMELNDCRAQCVRLQEEADAMRRERDRALRKQEEAVATMRSMTQKEADSSRVMREAQRQMERMDRQLDEVSSLARARMASRPPLNGASPEGTLTYEDS